MSCQICEEAAERVKMAQELGVTPPEQAQIDRVTSFLLRFGPWGVTIKRFSAGLSLLMVLAFFADLGLRLCGLPGILNMLATTVICKVVFALASHFFQKFFHLRVMKLNVITTKIIARGFRKHVGHAH